MITAILLIVGIVLVAPAIISWYISDGSVGQRSLKSISGYQSMEKKYGK